MFTKELPNQKAVDIALWDIVLKSEECDGPFPNEDQEKIKHLLSFFRQILIAHNFDKAQELTEKHVTYQHVLNTLIDVLSDMKEACNLELAAKLLAAVRAYESV